VPTKRPLAWPDKPPTQMDLDHAFKRRDWDPKMLARIQKACLSYPEVIEAEQFGGPWWKAGKKSFCCYGAASEKRADGYHGIDGVCVKLPLPLQQELIKQPRFVPEMYTGRHGWTMLRFEGRKAELDEAAGLIDIAYRLVANQRQMAALEARRKVR
jgi:predicted DNA-binding protein (MmcQ/YjbR family)